jgi:hypothetical protein
LERGAQYVLWLVTAGSRVADQVQTGPFEPDTAPLGQAFGLG